VDTERVGEHVVPAVLALRDAVEAGGLLAVDALATGAVVLRDEFLGLVAADEVVLLVPFQVGEVRLGPVGQGEQPRRGRD
jgi:hypothetical protein